MAKAGFLEKLVLYLTEEYAVIEEWTTELRKKEEKEYIRSIIASIQRQFPSAAILSISRSCLIECRNNPLLGFDGYRINVAGVCPNELKKLCMQLELNEEGKRISDLDVYYKGMGKISRKQKYQ